MVLPKLTLTYFSFGGRAEPLRLAAAIGKIPFTNRAIEYKDWPAFKSKTPLGQMPVLEIDDGSGGSVKTVVQSVAILRYLGKLGGGLYPTDDPVLALQVDSLTDTCSEATRSIEISVQNAKKFLLQENDWTKEEVLGIRNRVATDEKLGLPFYLGFFETALSKNRQDYSSSKWLVGSSVTIADLMLHRMVAWVSLGVLDGIPKEILDGYPLVKSHRAAIEALPEVVDWRAKHPAPYSTFDFHPLA